MSTSPRLGYTELASGQASPETTVNEMARYLEQGASKFIFKSRTTAAEPGSPSDGDCYLVPTSATGTHWSGKDGKIAFYENTAWVFLTAREGYSSYINDEDVLVIFDGTNWNTVAASNPNIQTVTSAATVTPTFLNDLVKVTAQAVGLTLANPTGTAVAGRGLAIRIKDNGTSQTIAFGTQYRAIGVTLPTATTINKTLYLGLIYNSDDTAWDVVAVAQQA